MRRMMQVWRTRTESRLLLAFVALLLVPGCGRKARAPVPPGPGPDGIELGIASWYGHPFHGRRTANGEVYDMEGMTAAHKSLPFDTWVEVNNLDNGRKTVVRINDRGPFIEGRIIDLSKRAAREINMIGPGTANVRLEIVGRSTPSRAKTYTVQVGAFRDRKNAARLREGLARRYQDVAMIKVEAPDRTFYRVRVGKFPDIRQAREVAALLRKEPGVDSPVVLGVSN